MSAGAVCGLAACALCAAALAALIKKSNRECALLLSAAAAVLILASAVEGIVPLIGQLAVSLCKDAGEAALAFGVEVAVKAAVLAVALPLLTQLFDYLGEIIKL